MVRGVPLSKIAQKTVAPAFEPRESPRASLSTMLCCLNRESCPAGACHFGLGTLALAPTLLKRRRLLPRDGGTGFERPTAGQ